jgi:molybdate transport system substrate-binding protein
LAHFDTKFIAQIPVSCKNESYSTLFGALTPNPSSRVRKRGEPKAHVRYVSRNTGTNTIFPISKTNSTSSLTQLNTLTIFAASSLTESFTALGRAYTTKTGIPVRFQFAGSQILRSQLENGANADLLASASRETILLLENTLLEPVRIFARNRLVLIAPKRGRGLVKTLADLGKSGVRLVIAQNTVPVGVYTRQMFAKLEATGRYGLDFAARVQKNVVSEETNVRQVALKVRLGEADAGVVYSTDVTPDLKPNIIEIAIPAQQNVLAAYPIAVLKQSRNLEAAREFVGYVLSPAGQGILQRWGFLRP